MAECTRVGIADVKATEKEQLHANVTGIERTLAALIKRLTADRSLLTAES